MSGSDLAILNLEREALASGVAEDGLAAIPLEVQGLGELAGGIGKEADLEQISQQLENRKLDEAIHLHQSARLGRAASAMPSYFVSTLVSFHSSQCGSIGGSKPVFTHTKGSLTATTKTWPASFKAGWLMYEGTCLLEQVPVKAPGTPIM